MIVIGIDPGTAETGYGIIRYKSKIELLAFGYIKTNNHFEQPYRLNLIYEEIVGLLKKHKPDVLAIESLFFFNNAKSISAVGQAMGVIKLAAARNKVKVLDYPPLRIKMMLTGKGRAEKKAVQQCVKKILKLKKPPRPTHAADALAVAICHLKQLKKA
jgi:crossover junction endodeoxyribonuclease RuvC